MKVITTINTVLKVNVSKADLLEFVTSKGIVPKDWTFYSIKVESNDTSEGMNLTIIHSVTKDKENSPT